MPLHLFLPTVKKYRGSYEGDRAFRGFRRYLAGEFGVPVATIALRFESLKFELNQYLCGRPPAHAIEIVSEKRPPKAGHRPAQL